MRIRTLGACALIAGLLAACGADEPLRIGFIGSLSDRVSDLGQAGQNGVILAVEQLNRTGGINGRLVELMSGDDASNKETSAKAADDLIGARVEAVIGPFTSGVAAVIVPKFNHAGILVISPTITGMDFYGKDDMLVRMNRTTRDNASDYAKVMMGRGQKQIAVTFDTRNRAFTESWLNEFRRAYTALGGSLVTEVPYESAADTDFAAIVRQMLAKPVDGLFFISAATDVARLAQQARRLAPQLPIGASEWAGTEQLAELGGSVVENLLIVQNYNRQDESPTYVQFREAYFKRFQRNPGYSSVMAYDAAIVLFDALRKRQKGESAKQAVLKYGPYRGLQQEIVFDANGDTQRKVFFTEIHGGRFELLN